MSISEDRAEPWIASGITAISTRTISAPRYFSRTKRAWLDARNVEALLFKGNMFLDLKKWRDAMNHYRRPCRSPLLRFEAQGMVDCNIGLQRQREAIFATGA